MIEEVEVALNQDIGEKLVPVEYAEFQFCRELGLKPWELDGMPEETYQLWRGFWGAEGVVATRRSMRASFLGG